jgi:TRAP-type C4-dicarboxylate transport system permease large subunit
MATGSVLSWLITTHHIPEIMGQWFHSVSGNWWVYLSWVMLFLLFMGCLIDPGSSLIMFVPIFAPIAKSYHIDPYHFGLLFVLNLQIGLLTPPVGLLLFLVARMGNITMEETVQGAWPFIILLVAVMMGMAYFPESYMWFPRMLGYSQPSG